VRERRPNTLWYLTRAEVAQALEHIDVVSVAAEVLRKHASGETVVPDEGYLGWQTPAGHDARSLNMPGLVQGTTPVVGAKIINASLGNTVRGIPRADGLTVLFDPYTAQPTVLMDAALISATRTAAVSTVAIETAAVHPVRRMAVLGCGVQARAHLDVLLPRLPELATIRLYDAVDTTAHTLARDYRQRAAQSGTAVSVAESAADAVRGADVVITVTTVTEGYIRPDWLGPGTTVVHVSLDDLLPEAVPAASRVIVDDWDLVRTDPHRLLGRMYRQQLLYGPDEPAPGPLAKQVDATLGQVLLDESFTADPAGVTVVNPFGMSIQDIVLADRIADIAHDLGLGTSLAR
jgi:ornithine cyclodeaminase/alanine dehydrogenase-like protein (mu-crystallin family)